MNRVPDDCVVGVGAHGQQLQVLMVDQEKRVIVGGNQGVVGEHRTILRLLMDLRVRKGPGTNAGPSEPPSRQEPRPAAQFRRRSRRSGRSGNRPSPARISSAVFMTKGAVHDHRLVDRLTAQDQERCVIIGL